MPRLYIANASKQRQLVYYRIEFDTDPERKESSSPLSQVGRAAPHVEIEPGQQKMIPGGDYDARGGGLLSKSAVDRIIRQLRPFGLVMETEMGDVLGRRDRTFTLIASIDTPVPRDSIDHVINSNHESKTGEGAHRRRQAAVAANESAERVAQMHMAQNGVPEDKGGLKQPLEFEVEQQELANESDKRLEEGFRVDKKAPPPKGRGRRAA
jgi:hypothetical protein